MPAASPAPEGLGGLALDVGAAEADVAQLAVVQLAQMMAVARPLLPRQQEV
jgi:hypothetical protein